MVTTGDFYGMAFESGLFTRSSFGSSDSELENVSSFAGYKTTASHTRDFPSPQLLAGYGGGPKYRLVQC
jgi:hypothetical protein